jgi:hypothetical protein
MKKQAKFFALFLRRDKATSLSAPWHIKVGLHSNVLKRLFYCRCMRFNGSLPGVAAAAMLRV